MYLSCKQSGILQTEDTHIWACLRTVLYSFRTTSGSLTIFAHEQVSPIYSSHCTFRNTSDFSSTFWTNFIVIKTCTRYLFLYLTQFVLFHPKQVDYHICLLIQLGLLPTLNYTQKLTVRGRLRTKLYEAKQMISILPMSTFHLQVATFPQHISIEYISLS